MRPVFLLISLLLLTACSGEQAIKEEIESAKHCEQDSDCTLVTSQCPFDCYQAVNSAEAERIGDIIHSFESGCEYSCVPVEGVACVDQTCTVLLKDFSS